MDQAFNTNRGAYEIKFPQSVDYVKSNITNKNNFNIFQYNLENPSKHNFFFLKQQFFNHLNKLLNHFIYVYNNLNDYFKKR